jgi:hypothetical protein
VKRAKIVRERGIPELVRCVERGDMAVSLEAEIGEDEPELEREILKSPPSSARDLRRQVAGFQRDAAADALLAVPNCTLLRRDIADMAGQQRIQSVGSSPI